MELDPIQIFIIGLVATAIIQILKILSAKFAHVKYSKSTLQIISAVVSMLLGVAFLWGSLMLDTSDPMLLIENILQAGGSIFLVATVIYIVILNKLLEHFEFDIDVERYEITRFA
jgi:hypothetical protein